MQATQEHVDADEGEGGNEQSDDCPPCKDFAAPACDEAQVQPDGVVEPDDECPSFFRVPAPVASAAHSAPRMVAMVKNRKPTAMALYMTSSMTCECGSDDFLPAFSFFNAQSSAMPSMAAIQNAP